MVSGPVFFWFLMFPALCVFVPDSQHLHFHFLSQGLGWLMQLLESWQSFQCWLETQTASIHSTSIQPVSLGPALATKKSSWPHFWFCLCVGECPIWSRLCISLQKNDNSVGIICCSSGKMYAVVQTPRPGISACLLNMCPGPTCTSVSLGTLPCFSVFTVPLVYLEPPFYQAPLPTAWLSSASRVALTCFKTQNGICTIFVQ